MLFPMLINYSPNLSPIMLIAFPGSEVHVVHWTVSTCREGGLIATMPIEKSSLFSAMIYYKRPYSKQSFWYSKYVGKQGLFTYIYI